jgi:hypothetical protein
MMQSDEPGYVAPGPECNEAERAANRHDPAEHGGSYRPDLEPHQ